MDFKYYKIPAFINVFIGLTGIFHAVLSKMHFFDGLIGFLSLSSLLLLIYVLSKGKAIGGGDIKLMAVSGILLGWKKNVLAFFLAGLSVLMFYPVRSRIFKRRKRLAFGPYLSLGIFISMIWGGEIISAYMHWPGIG